MASRVEAALLGVLEFLKADKDRPKSFGICGSIDGLWHGGKFETDESVRYGEVRNALTELFQLWPKFSGSVFYPVPDPTSDRDPAWAYDDAAGYASMWDKRTSYGKLRWELLNFCIDKLKGKQASE